jgi:hypothetical protein
MATKPALKAMRTPPKLAALIEEQNQVSNQARELAEMITFNPRKTALEHAHSLSLTWEEFSSLLSTVIADFRIGLCPGFFDSALGSSFPKRLLNHMDANENSVIRFVKDELGVVRLIDLKLS